MQTALGNFGKGVLHAVILFITLYGASLVQIIPMNIQTMTVGSILAFVISWITHSVVTPAGSRVEKSGMY